MAHTHHRLTHDAPAPPGEPKSVGGEVDTPAMTTESNFASYAATSKATCKVDDQVIFDEGDGEHTSSYGTVTRVWLNDKYVTVVSDGRTFVRSVERVHKLRASA